MKLWHMLRKGNSYKKFFPINRKISYNNKADLIYTLCGLYFFIAFKKEVNISYTYTYIQFLKIGKHYKILRVCTETCYQTIGCLNSAYY